MDSEPHDWLTVPIRLTTTPITINLQLPPKAPEAPTSKAAVSSIYFGQNIQATFHFGR